MEKTKTATTIEQQIERLRERGMTLDNEEKAKETLLDIGYFRLGFYWFPFECSYPRKTHRNHLLRTGTKFEYVMQLYYFDFDIRNILLRFISRIEINFRTQLIYCVSNRYIENPFWYVDRSVIRESLVTDAKYLAALKETQKEDIIRRNKKNHPLQPYAPAWKTIEYLSFGNVIKMYDNLKDGALRAQIARIYGIQSPNQFSNYINTVRRLRNACAHGKVLFDMPLPEAISTSGPAGDLGSRKTMLFGAYRVTRYLLGCVSVNRVRDMDCAMKEAFCRIDYREVQTVVCCNSGFEMDYFMK